MKFCSEAESVFKTKIYGKESIPAESARESTLSRIFLKHSFGGLRADTLTFNEFTSLYPFPGSFEKPLVSSIFNSVFCCYQNIKYNQKKLCSR